MENLYVSLITFLCSGRDQPIYADHGRWRNKFKLDVYRND